MTRILENLISNLIWVALLAIAGLIYQYAYLFSNVHWMLIALYIVLVVIFLNYKYRIQNKLRTVVGIRRIDNAMKDGITPEKALSLSKNNIKFLGIAANKLVNSPEFEKAIKRCNRPSQSIKFLLSSPEKPILRHAARRAGKELHEYQDMVKTTLGKLKRLKDEHGYNMEVRLYKSEKESGPPSFRLFFIDNKSVLVSYYLFGEGAGLQMPQIHIFKPDHKRDSENFYYAFEHYFDALWDSSEQHYL